MAQYSLHGTWNLAPRNRESAAAHLAWFAEYEKLPMTIPGDVHSALLKQKLIPDPYFGKNELSLQWIGKEDWTAEHTFNLDADFLSGRQFITLESADTFVLVYINGKMAGTCDNMFRFWRFDVTGLLKEGKNTVILIFESAERHALELASKLPYPIPFSVYPVFSPHRNLVRKTQCHAGWDWGPCLMVCGVYDSICLEQIETGFIDYVNTVTSQNGTEWEVEVATTYTSITDAHIPVTVKIEGPGIKPVITGTPVFVKSGSNRVIHTVTVNNPELWWPAGYSPEEETAAECADGFPFRKEQPLYTVTVTAGKAVKSKKIGFRTLEVVAEEDKWGKSLYFKVNGRAIFSKGSNWIPCDALPSRQTPQKYEQLLESLVQTGQNTVRIWGGGQYEKDCFYDICDRKGILIWHDFMFACSLYPSDQTFLENVRGEVTHQVQRLKDHPSLALWCGNNEDVGALTWYPESRENRDRYIIDYDRLNEGIIARTVHEFDPDRAWWPSSPSAGPNDFADCWHTDGRGDMHYWSVWHEKKPFEAYYDIAPRFVSEFGYQSFPSLSGVHEYAAKDQLNLTSPVMEFHQRCPSGNSIILENFSRYYRFPEGLENLLYLSQVQQAAAIKTAVEYWRSLRPVCMGSIIWQLNDLWPVASWSSLEYSGKWKLLHYAEKDFYAPLSIILYKKDGHLFVCGINDRAKAFSGEAVLRFTAFDGTVLKEIKLPAQIPADSAKTLLKMPLEELPAAACGCFLWAGLRSKTGLYVKAEQYTAAGHTDSPPVFAAENTLFFAFPKECELQKASITADIQRSGNRFSITLTADKPAFYVSVDEENIKGVFSGNLFTLLPGIPRTVIFSPEKETVSEEHIRKALRITSLRDTYK